MTQAQMMNATWRCRDCEINWDGEEVAITTENGTHFEAVGDDGRCPRCGKAGEHWGSSAQE